VLRLRLGFYSFASICLGVIAVATGGVRAIAITFGLDATQLDRYGVVASIVVGLIFLATAIVPPPGAKDR
jgi:hypothetical protein